jgi:glutamyl-tRNA reductase
VSIVAIGLNHRTAPLELLERMTVDAGHMPKVLDDLLGREHVSEAVVLSTCNRTEVYVVAERFHGAYHDIRDFFSDLAYLPPEQFTDHLYVHYDSDAASHLFGVAAGLDSAVLGETEILGQVRDAWDLAQQEGAAGAALNLLFRHAIEVGKRARTETGISRNIASVSQAAVAMASERLGSLDGRRILVLGAGDMGEGMVQALKDAGVTHVQIANRTFEKAVALADQVEGRAIRIGEVPAALRQVDVLLTSTGASALMLEQADLVPVTAERDRELLIVDIAVPRDIDPSAGELDGITLLDMDDLRMFADAGIEERQREVASVQHVIHDELERFVGVATAREVAPLIAALRDGADEVRVSELERYASRLAELSPEQLDVVEALTKGIVNKLLHGPTIELKESAGSPRGERLADALRDLFDLE